MTTAVVTVTALKKHLTPTRRAARASYAVRVLKKRPQAVVRVSDQTYNTFRKIADPANAHLFTAESALDAFAHID
jgi:NMD protein affecting ribosome stability and mRNA decay